MTTPGAGSSGAGSSRHSLILRLRLLHVRGPHLRVVRFAAGHASSARSLSSGECLELTIQSSTLALYLAIQWQRQSIERRLIQFIVANANHPKLPTQTILDQMQSRRAGAEDMSLLRSPGASMLSDRRRHR